MLSPKMVGDALSNATPSQLIRVSALITKLYCRYGYSTYNYKPAIDAFNKGDYYNPALAELFPADELDRALNGTDPVW